MKLIERMRAQLFVWEDNEPDMSKWSLDQREYAEAFKQLEWTRGMLRELSGYSPGELGNMIIAQTVRHMIAKTFEELGGNAKLTNTGNLGN